jgi:hypothetical protein
MAAIHQSPKRIDTRVPATSKASPGSDRSGRRSFSEAGKPAYDD